MAAKPVPTRHTDGTIRWKVRFRLTPGTNPTSESFDTQQAADKFARLVDSIGGTAARATRTASDTSGRDTPTLATYLTHHLTKLGGSCTPGTVAEYRRVAARTWLPRLGPLPLDAIDRDMVDDWITAQRAVETLRSKQARARALTAQAKGSTDPIPSPRTYTPKSIAEAHSILSAVLQRAVDDELLTRNIAKGAALPSDAERLEMVILTENEFVTLFDALPDRWRPLVGLLYGTGLRWGEATALTPGDLDLDGVTPVLRVTRAWKKGEAGVYLGGPKTRRGRRTVAIPAQLVPALRDLTRGRPADALLFTAVGGGRVSGQKFHDRVWKPALVRSGISKRPRVHDLRHTHASLMIARGMDLLQLQHRLGHESLKVTGDTYGHLMPDALATGGAFATATMAGALPMLTAD